MIEKLIKETFEYITYRKRQNMLVEVFAAEMPEYLEYLYKVTNNEVVAYYFILNFVDGLKKVRSDLNAKLGKNE